MIRKLLPLGVLMICLNAFSNETFDQFFTTKSLRYDFLLVGNNLSEKVVYAQTKIEPYWGGNPNYLVEEVDYGSYRYSVFDVESGMLLFQKGFCPLFWEWQTTAEAKLKEAAYYQAVFFPKPKNNVLLKIENRNDDNSWNQLHIDTLKAANYFNLEEQPVQFKYKYLQHEGASNEKIDIAILSEGYTKKEMRKFRKDAQGLVDSLFMAEPFKTYRKRFNVVIVNVPSIESGTDIPGELIYKNTALNSTFYTFDSPRYLTTTDMKSVYDAAAIVPWDQLYVLVNTATYGGGGFYNFLSICSSNNERSSYVFAHEFGHAFAGLGDEYYTSSTSYESFYNLTVEPWEPNLTTLINFDSKWKSMVDTSTPIPTLRTAENNGIVGVYQGGGYVDKGVYSPANTCWMKEQAAGAFCPVCQKTIEQAILSQTK